MVQQVARQQFPAGWRLRVALHGRLDDPKIAAQKSFRIDWGDLPDEIG